MVNMRFRMWSFAVLFLFVFIVQEIVGIPRPNSDHQIREKRELNGIQEKLVALLNPQPLIDMIKEKDKFGNIGDHPLGQKFVSTFENISRVLSSALTIPTEKVKQVSRGATEFLNQIGGKLVGLQK